MKKYILLSFLFGMLVSCQNESSKPSTVEAKQTISERVTDVNTTLNDILQEKFVLNLDHHKMAQEEGVYTPPAIATLFSDSEINTALIKQNPLIGLDLPFKTLCFAEADTTNVFLAYTSSQFIAKRHGLNIRDLDQFESRISEIINGVDNVTISEVKLDSVGLGFGIIKVESDFNFRGTIQKLTETVKAQNDTRWFGEIDFQKEARALGQETAPATLLLFGGPAPGGKAMMTTPKIGLDAFCQKLLVYENNDGDVWVAFNNIVAFSELYYGLATKPQKLINKRLKATFTNAVKL